MRTDAPYEKHDPRHARWMMAQVMRHCAQGHTDEATGHDLEVSVRTVRRYKELYWRRVGARTAFQAGMAYADRRRLAQDRADLPPKSDQVQGSDYAVDAPCAITSLTPGGATESTA